MGNAKWTIPKLIAAGYSATDFKDAGLSAAAIRSLGFGELTASIVAARRAVLDGLVVLTFA